MILALLSKEKREYVPLVVVGSPKTAESLKM